MKLWLVRIDGDAFDLEQLSKLYNTPRYSIYKEQDCYYLTSSDFDQCASYDLVLNTANDIVERINGAVSLLFNDIGPVRVGDSSELRQDGNRHYFIRLSAGSYKMRTSLVELTITDANGNTIAPVGPMPLETVMGASEQSEAVKDALRFFRIGDWVSLYKVFEIIRDEVGQKAIDDWITEQTRSRFTGTAQSRDVLGDQARHASRKYHSPSNPMSQGEAQQAIAKILRSWLKITS